MLSFTGKFYSHLYSEQKYLTLSSFPVGLNGQNYIVVPTPITFLPIAGFEKGQNEIDSDSCLGLTKSMLATKSSVIEKKEHAKSLKEKGNIAFSKKKYEDAEKYYSDAIQLNIGSRPLWTNRAACRNTMRKYKEAISDCDTALSIDSKCIRSITQKGNALLGLNRFDEAKDCYESLRSLGDENSADKLLKELHNIQEMISS